MFDPFFTTKTSGRRQGSGFGLSIVQRVVADHGGHLDFTTAPGAGTQFVVYLPRLAAEVPSAPAAELSRGSERILLVDDDRIQRQLIGDLLRGLGYTVASASSGEEAVQLAQADPPALAILDMLLGDGIDGAETYRQLVEMCPGQRAILLSGFAETDRVELALTLGAGPFLHKPVSMEQLAVVVRQSLDNPARNRMGPAPRRNRALAGS
jgi:CheY-like chemotaxis protein